MQTQPYTVFMRDWSNRIARPIQEDSPPGHAYSLAEFQDRQGKDLYLFAGRAVMTDQGHANALAMAEGAPVVAYCNVLHTKTPAAYASDAWPWYAAEGTILDGTELQNVEGLPSVRWHAADPINDAYHTNPRLVDPAEWATLVAEWWTERHPVDGIFLDYLAEEPWTYPQDPALELSDPDLEYWKDWQVAALSNLRIKAPGLLIIANGRWAAEAPWWTTPGAPVDVVYLEKMGGLWWAPPEALQLLGHHTKPETHLPPVRPPMSDNRAEYVLAAWQGRHLLDVSPSRQSPIWNLDQIAPCVSASTGWAWGRNWAKV